MKEAAITVSVAYFCKLFQTPVPNWLREEIIKTKASITSSSAGHPKFEAQSGKDEGADKFFEKSDQEDNKSIELPRSTGGG